MNKSATRTLVGDVGSSSSRWAFAGGTGLHQMRGFNPLSQQVKLLDRMVRDLKTHVEIPETIFYYGAGIVNRDTAKQVRTTFQTHFGDVPVEVHSDAMGAARALLGDRAGYIGILGTGSYAGYFDGNTLVPTQISLGYPLGDEGAGWRIGAALIRAYYYGTMPKRLAEEFGEFLPHDHADFVKFLRSSPAPNRYLASFAAYAAKNHRHNWVAHLVRTEFREFVRKKLANCSQETQIHFIGGVANGFKPLLAEILTEHQLSLGLVLQEPIKSLLKYHSSQ